MTLTTEKKDDPDKNFVVFIDDENDVKYLAYTKGEFQIEYEFYLKWNCSNDTFESENEDGEYKKIINEKSKEAYREQINRIIKKGFTLDYQDLKEWESEKRGYENELLEREIEGDSYDPIHED